MAKVRFHTAHDAVGVTVDWGMDMSRERLDDEMVGAVRSGVVLKDVMATLKTRGR